MENILKVCVQLFNGKCIGGMHGQCDHGADGRKVYLYHTVVISKVGRSQLLIVGGTAMHRKEFLRRFVG